MSGGDGDVDLFGNYNGYTLLVQCKNYSTAKVDASDIDTFEGVLSRYEKGNALGIFITSIPNDYSLNAIDKADSSNHNLLLTNIIDMRYDIPSYQFKNLDESLMKEMKEGVKKMREEIKEIKAMFEKQKRTIENQGIVIRNIKKSQNRFSDHQIRTADLLNLCFRAIIFLFICSILIILIKYL
jgi:Protein of unknown function (DUF2034)